MIAINFCPPFYTPIYSVTSLVHPFWCLPYMKLGVVCMGGFFSGVKPSPSWSEVHASASPSWECPQSYVAQRGGLPSWLRHGNYPAQEPSEVGKMEQQLLKVVKEVVVVEAAGAYFAGLHIGALHACVPCTFHTFTS